MESAHYGGETLYLRNDYGNENAHFNMFFLDFSKNYKNDFVKKNFQEQKYC